MPDSEFYVGLDLGQAQDFTGIVIVEKIAPAGSVVQPFWMSGDPFAHGERDTSQDKPTEYHIRHIERIALRTPYPTVVVHVKELLAAPQLAGRTVLIVDRTGVGRGVVDLLDERNVDHVRVTIHGGDQVVHEGSEYRVPKRDLVGTLQVLFQSERLKIAAELPHAQTLTAELLAFRAKINASNGHDSYEAEWREGSHDDLVLAAAMACWYAESVGRLSFFFA